MSFRWIPLSRRVEKARRGVATAPGRSKHARRRMVLESLEDRTLLSTSIPLSSSQWTPYGPAPILGTATLGETPGNLPTTGRIAAIAASPTDPNTIYIAAAGGGVWKTTNGGGNWAPLTDNQATLFMGAITIAPSNPNVIYAGTGDPNNTPESFYGQGILKSTDGGSTWTLQTANGKFAGTTVSKIVVDPTNPNKVFAAVDANGRNGTPFNAGIYGSTDGGATWLKKSGGISAFDQYTDLLMDPTNPSTLYTAVGTPNGAGANGVYQSLNSGNTWTLLGGGLPSGNVDGRITLAMAPSNSSVLYAAITGSGQTNSSAFGTLFRMMKSADGGNTWTDLTANTPNYLGVFGQSDTALAVDPVDPQVVYAGGSSVGGGAGIIETRNGGNTWISIDTDAVGNGPSFNHFTMGFDAAGRLLDGTDGGLFRLDNPIPGSVSWNDLNGDLQITQLESIALDPTDPNTAYAGGGTNGTEKFTDSTQWTLIENARGGYVRVDPTNTSIVYHTFAIVRGPGFFERSTDGGATWTSMSNGINAGSAGDPSNLYPPFVLDPSNPARLLLGTDRVYETTNSGGTWVPISTPGQAGWKSGPGVTINSIAVAPSSPNTIYVATSDGHVYVTNNDGVSWTATQPTGVESATGLVVSPTDPKVAFVVRNGNSSPSNSRVFATANSGQTWTDISGNLPDIPAWSLAIDFTRSTPLFFVGTDTGVYSSSDRGTTWAPFQSGLPNAQVTSLEVDPNLNILAAGTLGRGMFEIKEVNPLQITPQAPPSPDEGSPLTNVLVATFRDGASPDPIGNYSATINWGDGKPASNGTITPAGGSTFAVRGSHTYADEGTFTITITVTDSDGDQAQATTSVTVNDAALTPSNGFTITATESSSFSGLVGSFTDGNSAAAPSDFTATIIWGNGRVSNGTVAADPNTPGKFNVSGTNIYGEEGSFGVRISVVDKGGSTATVRGTAQVADAPLNSTGLAVAATEGIALTGLVASFTDADPQGALGDYTAQIDWGDGTPGNPDITTGTVSASGSGGFIVSGNHTYLEEGSYTIQVTIQDAISTTSTSSIATVADAPLTAASVSLNATEGQILAPVGQPAPVVATFTDANPSATLDDFAAPTIHWGDGQTSTGVIASLGGGKFSVSGNHTYVEEGTYSVTVPIIDNGGGRTLNDPTDATVTASSSITVIDAPLSSNGTNISGVEGIALSSGGQAPVVATFDDQNVGGTVSDFTATINWGDGTTANPHITTGVVTQPGGPGTAFHVQGSTSIAKAGTYSVVVTITDMGGSTTTATTTATIADAPLTGAISTLAALSEGGTFNGTVGTFTDPNTQAVPGDFIASIDWGNGNSGIGTVTSLGGGKFAVTSSNTYAEEGSYTVKLSIIDLGGSRLTLSGTATVHDAPIAPAGASPAQVAEGTSFSGTVVTFTESSVAPPSDFSATINWGDGTTSPGSIIVLPLGKFGVQGGHSYAEEGNFTISVSISDVGGSKATVTNTASVFDALLSASRLTPNAILGQAFTGPVATFTDGNTAAPVSDFSATITWGDGHVSSGQIVSLGGGNFQVVGTNTFAIAGQVPLSVTITDAGGATATASGVSHVLRPLIGATTSPIFTNGNQPKFSGTAEPNTEIQLFALNIDTGARTLIAQAISDASGAWSATSLPLADGRYLIQGTSLTPGGQTLETISIGVVIIDTTGPTVASASFNAAQGKLVITFQDALSGMNPAGLLNPANFVLTLPGRSARSFPVTGFSFAAGPAGSGQLIETISYNLGRKVAAGAYVLTLNATGLTDRAGNTLVEKTFVTFPQTSNSPNPNYVAQFTVTANGETSGPFPYVSLAEQRAAARFTRFSHSRTRTRPIG